MAGPAEELDMPPALSGLLEGGSWERNTLGWSGAVIYRIDLPPGRSRFLKVTEDGKLERERDVYAWLEAKVPVPKVSLQGRSYTLQNQ
jgi:aminoglycoside phosphotransferase